MTNSEEQRITTELCKINKKKPFGWFGGGGGRSPSKAGIFFRILNNKFHKKVKFFYVKSENKS